MQSSKQIEVVLLVSTVCALWWANQFAGMGPGTRRVNMPWSIPTNFINKEQRKRVTNTRVVADDHSHEPS